MQKKKKNKTATLPNKFLMTNALYKKTKIPQNKSMLIFLEWQNSNFIIVVNRKIYLWYNEITFPFSFFFLLASNLLNAQQSYSIKKMWCDNCVK
jgi:hypothetical protein